jgi:hypothetical protein
MKPQDQGIYQRLMDRHRDLRQPRPSQALMDTRDAGRVIVGQRTRRHFNGNTGFPSREEGHVVKTLLTLRAESAGWGLRG